MPDARPREPAHAPPGQDRRPRQREREGDEEEEEPRGERAVRVHAQASQEADEERFADREAVDREGHEDDEEEERPHDVVGPRREVDADRLPGEPDGEHAEGLNEDGEREDAGEQRRGVAVRVDALVDGPQRPVDPEPREDRDHSGERPARGAGEERHAEHDRPDDERGLDPEVGAHVVAADGEREPERSEDQRRRTAERSPEQHGPRDRPSVPGMAPRRLEDARGVAADRRGEHLADHVRDEIRPHEPRKSVLHALRAQEPLPAPRHRPDGDDHDRERGQEVADPSVGQLVPGATEVDLPHQVCDREPGDDERPGDAQQPSHPANRAWTRWRAAITSATSSSEWAGESGSESTWSPARSATGSGGWSGKRSRYHESRWTGRKWMLVPIRSSARARWYSSRVAPARSASMRTM